MAAMAIVLVFNYRVQLLCTDLLQTVYVVHVFTAGRLSYQSRPIHRSDSLPRSRGELKRSQREDQLPLYSIVCSPVYIMVPCFLLLLIFVGHFYVLIIFKHLCG